MSENEIDTVIFYFRDGESRKRILPSFKAGEILCDFDGRYSSPENVPATRIQSHGKIFENRF